MLNSRKRKKISGIVASTAAVEAIILSFGKSAFAETGADYDEVTLNTVGQSLCVPEGDSYTINTSVVPTVDYPATAYMSGSPTSVPEDFFITDFVFSSAVGGLGSFPITPTTSNFNGYPGLPSSTVPGIATIRPEFSFTAPAISFAQLSGDYDVNITATAREHFGAGSWGDDIPNSMIVSNSTDQEFFTITVEHVNEAPTLTAAPSSHTSVVSSAVNVDVTATVNDEEGNEVDILFELTDDNFATILQTATYQDVNLVPGEDFIQAHTFTNLGTGDYNWRVRAYETGTDVTGTCVGEVFEIPADPLVSTRPVMAIQLTTNSGTSIEGYVFIDSDNDGIFDADEDPVPNVTVFVTDSSGQQAVVTDANGYFTAVVNVGSVTIIVDETDVDIPANYVSRGPVTVNAVLGSVTRAELPLTTLADSGISPVTTMLLGVFALALLFASHSRRSLLRQIRRV